MGFCGFISPSRPLRKGLETAQAVISDLVFCGFISPQWAQEIKPGPAHSSAIK